MLECCKKKYLKHRFYIIYEVLEYALLHNELDQIRTRRNKKAPFPILTAIFKFKAGSHLPIKQPKESKFAQSFGLLIAIYCASCDKTRKSALRGTYIPPAGVLT